MLYPSSNSFYCYGCGTGGSTIDFVSILFHISPLEAGRKLSHDFRLGLFEGKSNKEVDRQIKNRMEEKKLLQSFEQWTSEAYITVCDYFSLLQSFKESYKPNTQNKPYHDLFVEACHNLDYISWLIDSLMYADFETNVELYNVYRKEVSLIAHRVKQCRENNGTKNTA